jgi:hypothetical protein
MADYNPKDLTKLIQEGDAGKIKAYMDEYDLVLSGSKIVPKSDKAKEHKAEEAFMDMRQHSRKILLNS